MNHGKVDCRLGGFGNGDDADSAKAERNDCDPDLGNRIKTLRFLMQDLDDPGTPISDVCKLLDLSAPGRGQRDFRTDEKSVAGDQQQHDEQLQYLHVVHFRPSVRGAYSLKLCRFNFSFFSPGTGRLYAVEAVGGSLGCPVQAVPGPGQFPKHAFGQQLNIRNRGESEPPVAPDPAAVIGGESLRKAP